MTKYVDCEALRDALYDADAVTMRGVAIINKFPAADVTPVVHASWIWPNDKRSRPYCSQCFNDTFWEKDYGFATEAFCPFCGAAMDADS